ncbi:MAG: sensor histidine kinase [Lachnospiraceae bacterium]|jgi:two-component system sensor histidine kinase YesM
MKNKIQKWKYKNGIIRPLTVMPLTVCITFVDIAATAIAVLIFVDAVCTSFKLVSLLLTMIIIAVSTLALIIIIRANRPTHQLDMVINRIIDEVGENNEDIRRNSAWNKLYIASENIEQMFNEYLTAVNKEYAGELLVRQAQFATLQSQIHPHFLYNTLESIRGHALMEGVPEIADMAEALSRFFRYNISQIGDFVTIDQELDNARDYFKIQKYRFGEKLNYEIIFDKTDSLDNYFMPKLTLQPIIENSIVHGFEGKLEPGLVSIRVVMSKKTVRIIVKDNGMGMDEEILVKLKEHINKEDSPNLIVTRANEDKKHKSMALKNVNQRIKMFFGQGHGLYITSLPQIGTVVEIIIPTITQPPEINKNEVES